MVADGFLIEVAQLIHVHGASNLAHLVGYRQAVEFLQAHADPTPRHLQQFVVFFQAATRSYAKRQLTWARRSHRLAPLLRFVPADAVDSDTDRLVGIFLELYHQTPEEYVRDDRWRATPPPLNSTKHRTYVSALEAFAQVSACERVLSELASCRRTLAWARQ